MNDQVLIYGASGHGKVIVDILERNKKRVLGFLDDDQRKWGVDFFGYKILGDIAFLELNKEKDYGLIIAIGDNQHRKQVAVMLNQKKVHFDKAVHRSAVIGRNVEIGEGSVVMAGAVVNSDAKIGIHVIVNTSSSIDHDCKIEDFVHISPGVHMGGGIFIGEGSWIGLGASIINNCKIGRNVIIGMGAVVTKDILDNWVVAGNPASFLRLNEKFE